MHQFGAAEDGLRQQRESPPAMFKMLILVCSINVTPADCGSETALDVVSGPEVPSELLCGLHGQAYIAGTAFATRTREDEYVKIRCTREPVEAFFGRPVEAFHPAVTAFVRHDAVRPKMPAPGTSIIFRGDSKR